MRSRLDSAHNAAHSARPAAHHLETDAQVRTGQDLPRQTWASVRDHELTCRPLSSWPRPEPPRTGSSR